MFTTFLEQRMRNFTLAFTATGLAVFFSPTGTIFPSETLRTSTPLYAQTILVHMSNTYLQVAIHTRRAQTRLLHHQTVTHQTRLERCDDSDLGGGRRREV